MSQISWSAVYELIRAGRIPIATKNSDQRYMIAESVVPQVRRVHRRSEIIAALIKRGRSPAAARKWLYRQERQGRTLAEIATTANGTQ